MNSINYFWMLGAVSVGYLFGCTVTVSFLLGMAVSRMKNKKYKIIAAMVHFSMMFVAIGLISLELLKLASSIWDHQQFYDYVGIAVSITTVAATFAILKRGAAA